VIQALLDRHVQAGAIAGAVALVTAGDTEALTTAGLQDRETGAPMRPDTIFRIISMTKPITAAAAMILVEDGRLALEDAVGRLLPELADRRVLRTRGSPLDDTVPAVRPIVVEDPLTLRAAVPAARHARHRLPRARGQARPARHRLPQQRRRSGSRRPGRG
jgi:CubicO group peptidase (beta-lactamase class C family)